MRRAGMNSNWIQTTHEFRKKDCFKTRHRALTTILTTILTTSLTTSLTTIQRMDRDRWNGTGTADAENSVGVTLCGTQVTLAQDADSMQCGTTAWDASFVLAKYLERNLSNVEGKTVVELGAGISGLPGMACALLGAAQVVLTDVAGPVLSLLRKNVERNVSLAQISMNGSALSCTMKRAPDVLELRWGVAEDVASCVDRVEAIDYILCADCVYDENAVGILLETIVRLLELRGKRTTKVLVRAGLDCKFGVVHHYAPVAPAPSSHLA